MGLTLSIYFAQLIEVATLAVGFYVYKALPDKFKVLVLLVSISTFFDLTLGTLSRIFGSNHVFLQFFTPVSYIFIIIFLFYGIKNNSARLIKWFLFTGYLIFVIIAKLTFESFMTIDNYSSSVANSIIVIVTTYFLLTNSSIKNSEYKPNIIAMIGILVYYGGGLFIFALSNVILSPNNLMLNNIWIIHSILHIIFDISLIIAFIELGRIPNAKL